MHKRLQSILEVKNTYRVHWDGVRYFRALPARESAALRAPKATVASVCIYQILRLDHREVSRVGMLLCHDLYNLRCPVVLRGTSIM